jgi:hypothetical protein
MTQSQIELFISDSEKVLNSCLELIKKKNHDYAEDSDIFSNFDFAAKTSGVSASQALMAIVGVKISRLSQLVGNGKEPVNEKIDDTIKDVINYMLLLRGILSRNQLNN